MKWLALVTLGCFCVLASYSAGYTRLTHWHRAQEVRIWRWDATTRAQAIIALYGQD